MSFESRKTTKETIEFSSHELSFVGDLTDGKFDNVSIICAVRHNGDKGVTSMTSKSIIHTNEESLREFHRVLSQVLDHVDKQRGVGRDLDG